MTIESDTRIWDKAAPSYAKSPVADEQGYQRTLQRTREHLKPQDKVLELGCGTGSTALLLAGGVQSYLATDLSSGMIGIAEGKQQTGDEKLPGLSFRTATAEDIASEEARFNAVLGFNYLHLVPDLTGTLRNIHTLLEDGGLFISKTGCLKDMSFLYRLALPVGRLLGKVPSVSVFSREELEEQLRLADFEVLETEFHASDGSAGRPYIVARKK
ncbi:methylase [Stachybotrys elegans]|uniref:Methylase n=1 Tax=Stachybotrys elegans TaxID=80388 RepID=A0A8K0WRU6_9HYPO|nr:methylase [Stachybotrys elegans]